MPDVSWPRGVSIYQFAFEMMQDARKEPLAVMGMIAGAAVLDPAWAKRFVETFCPLKEGVSVETDENNLRHLITHLDPELPKEWACTEHELNGVVDTLTKPPTGYMQDLIRRMFDQGMPE